MTSGLQPELLNEKQKRWLATAICGAVTADGSIAPEGGRVFGKSAWFPAFTD